MNPIVHGELSWSIAQRLPERRDRALVAIAGRGPVAESRLGRRDDGRYQYEPWGCDLWKFQFTDQLALRPAAWGSSRVFEMWCR